MRKLRGFYGVDVPSRVASLLLNTAGTAWCSYLVYHYWSGLCLWLQGLIPAAPHQLLTFIVGFLFAIIAFYACCYAYTLVATLHTSLFLRPRVARQMTAVLPGWSRVGSVLDLGCGRGVLLATIALRLDKEGDGGRVVGYDCWKSRDFPGRFDAGSMAKTLRRTAQERVDHIVTCKSGPLHKLPFSDQIFDAVFSALSLHASQEAERRQCLFEVERVLKPGGHVVIWDVLYGDEYGEFFKERKWKDVRVVTAPSAFLLPTKVVVAQKP